MNYGARLGPCKHSRAAQPNPGPHRTRRSGRFRLFDPLGLGGMPSRSSLDDLAALDPAGRRELGAALRGRDARRATRREGGLACCRRPRPLARRSLTIGSAVPKTVSKQSTSATRIDPLAGRVIPHVAMSQKFVSQPHVSFPPLSSNETGADIKTRAAEEPPSWHRLGPGDVPFEAQRCRHRAIAPHQIPVGNVVAARPAK
jgi:hypothetical protein